MSTAGIDLGSESLVVALSRRKGVDIIDNEASQRLTPSLVAYSSSKRHCGAAAYTFRARNVKNTIFSVKEHLGSDYVDNESLNVSTQKADNGLRQFVVDAYGKQTPIYPEQAVASLLKYINKMVMNANENLPIASCVFTLPGYMGNKPRAALLRACEIANINCSAIISDQYAISMNYLIKRLGNFTEQPQHALFIDIGYSHASVFITEFTNTGFKILTAKHSVNVSGSCIDNILIQNVMQDIKNKYGYDLKKNVRACLRLNEAIASAKKTLSVNPEARYHLECLFEDTDVSGSILLNDFNDAIGDMAAELGSMINEAIQESKVDPSTLIAAEIVGGVTRVPLFQNVITSVTGLQPSRGLNADECVAIGAAWAAATKSAAFSGKIKELVCCEYNPHQIYMKSNIGNDVSLWKPGFINPTLTKNIKMNIKNNGFEGSIFKDHEEILRITIPDVSPQDSVTINLKHDNFGSFIVSSEQHKTRTEMPEVKTPSSPAPTSVNPSENNEDASAAPEEAPIEEPTPKIVNYTTPLKVEVLHAYTFSDDLMKNLISIESKMTAKDEEVDKLDFAKHDLENFCSKSRQMLRGSNAEYCENPQKVIDALQEIEFWFEDYCDEASLKQVNQKIEEAHKLTQNFYNAMKEASDRQDAASRLVAIESEITQFIQSTDQKYAHIDAEARQKLYDETVVIINELKRLIEDSNSLPKYASPKILAKEVDEKIKTIRNVFLAVRNTPVPKKEEVVEPKTENIEEEVTPQETEEQTL